MWEKILTGVCGKIKDKPEETKNGHDDTRKTIKGSLVLSKKNFMDVTNLGASFLDRIYDLFGKGVSLQLISSVQADPGNGSKGKKGKEAYLEKWNSTFASVVAGSDATFNVTFRWDESMRVPGAFTIKNYHHSEFYLKTLTLTDVPGHGLLVFVCNSWIYPAHRYKSDRIFFTNKAYLPSDTPELLRPYREEELVTLRGSGSGMLQEWDRVYDYACYNDLGTPDNTRIILGGSKEFPYPRRGRTGRAPTKKDPSTETRLSLLNLNIYVPRDERFNHVKFSDFVAWAMKSLGQVLLPEIIAVFDKTINEFDSFEDMLKLYDGGIELANSQTIDKMRKCIPFELVRELARNDGERFLKFPMPHVIKEDKSAWRTDEEFAREMLAGLNPVVIRRLQEFPPSCTLDPEKYGNQTSSITREHIEKNMDGHTVDEALRNNRIFILDHHDVLMPHLRRINTTTTKTYSTRTLLFLQDDGTLMPLAIELSLPHPEGDIYGAKSQVFTPAEHGVESSIWQLAKAYVAINDSGYHNLISHWLNTHAVIEPFIIATHRHLSVLHPMYKLLHPHFRDTMNINALARHTLINAGGVVELTVFPEKYSLEMSAAIYSNWVFTEQALPLDLIKRGMAVEDSSRPHGVRLLIEDYPFAVDGLEVWSAIKDWVNEYCCFYYKSDEMVQADTEIQAWWTELRNVGHGDLKDEKWWPEMQTVTELVDSCTIIIWVASALHAAVNFGQYPYAGYLPNRPTMSRRFMPEPGTSEYAELQSDPDLFFLKTITPQLQTLIGISLIEVLSRHSSDEVYLGQREDPEWTLDDQPREAFKAFSNELINIENRILKRNNDKRLKNRFGPVKVPYMLLYPNTSDYKREAGITGLGIPNSTSV